MFLLAHAAAGLLTGLIFQAARPGRAVRLRWWVLGALLSDLIDKPLSLLLPVYEGYGRGPGHTLLLVLLLLAAGARSARIRAVAIGAASHLLLDAPWTYLAWFAWPTQGFVPAPGVPVDPEGYLAILLANPHVLAGELAGALVLLMHGWARLVQVSSTRAPAVTIDLVMVPSEDRDTSDAEPATGGQHAAERRSR